MATMFGRMVKVMGIVNVTPDSFSDGGRYFSTEEAVKRVHKLFAEGADYVDIGGESTRPSATPISWQEEWERIESVLKAINGTGLISVDTYHPETAERAMALGVRMINCVKIETVGAMLELARKNPSLEVVIPSKAADIYPDWVAMKDRIYLDPMIGFDTTREEDIALLRGVRELSKLGKVLVGASRKRIVKKLTGEKVTGKNLGGNLAIAMWCALNGASMIRVHDVIETVQALKVLEGLEWQQF